MPFAFIINLVSRWSYNQPTIHRTINGGQATRRETPIYRTTGINCSRSGYRNATFSEQQLEHARTRIAIRSPLPRTPSPRNATLRKQIFQVFFAYFRAKEGSVVGASPPFATLLLRPITRRGHYPGGNFCKTKERGRKEEGRKGGKREGQGDRKFEGRQRWVQKRRINVAPNVGPKPNYAN